VDGFVLDWGGNGFLDREPRTLEWIDSLGLSDGLVRANTAAAKRFIYRHGRLHEIKGPPAFFFSSLLSWKARLRLCFEPFIPAKRERSPESIHGFASRRIGAEAARIMVGAMVLGVYGGDAEKLSMEHCFPRMTAMERDYGGLMKALLAINMKRRASPMGPPGVLTSFEGGTGTLVEKAAALLGDRIRYNSAAKVVTKTESGYTVSLADGRQLKSRAVIVALPSHGAAKITAGLDLSLSQALDEIPYAGLAVVSLCFPREAVGHDLDGFGFLVPRGEGVRTLGCLWTSTLFPSQAPEDSVLLRVMIGGATDPEALGLSDEQLVALALEELTPLLDIKGEATLTRVMRHEQGIPQYTLGHEERLSAIEAGEEVFPGLAFAGNAYRGIGLNDCVLSADRALGLITDYLA
jgi:oxygen-dependent protoporphyrinogen oxidase